MGKLFSLNINLSKIDKSKLVKGEKGVYLDLTITEKDEVDQYGNILSSWQSQTKEEREAKQDRNFVGNGKLLYDGAIGLQPLTEEEQDDLGF